MFWYNIPSLVRLECGFLTWPSFNLKPLPSYSLGPSPGKMKNLGKFHTATVMKISPNAARNVGPKLNPVPKSKYLTVAPQNKYNQIKNYD